jgi:glycogen debranching enzyme
MPIDAPELPIRRQPRAPGADDGHQLLSREWLVTNGLGGYASGTVAGVATRRYHGLLVAALPNPLGRTVMLGHLAERLLLPDGSEAELTSGATGPELPATRWLGEFRLEGGLPVWQYAVRGALLERRILMPHRQNTVHIVWRLLGGPAEARLDVRPLLHVRSYEAPVSSRPTEPYRLTLEADHYVIAAGEPYPALRLLLRGDGATFTAGERGEPELRFAEEAARGYPETGSAWSPGHFTLGLALGRTTALVASTEPYEIAGVLTPEDALAAERERRIRLLAAAPPEAQHGIPAELVLAAGQIVIAPAGRPADAARARATGDEIRTIIAGYHWFTDWGRDTMISLEGLTITTGRQREAGSILRTFAHYVRDGLIPNMFPDGSDEGLYHTADATLWFFHALDRYVTLTGNRSLVAQLLPTLSAIIDWHRRGTRFGIGVDPADGLLHQGAEGYQLTWMDAKVDGWVVTPRRGKAVEINALWYNALRLLAGWLHETDGPAAAAAIEQMAERARRSFNARFWCAERGHLYDVVDGPAGDDPSLRPNQLFAISLPHPVLDERRWQAVLESVERALLTPVGLRSLAPGSPGYHARYYGDLRARDAAYHQGTVWAWLIGPWIDAWLKVHPARRAEARGFLGGLAAELDDLGVGTVGEIFDAEPPYAPRGCIAQAWSVAELLRSWLRLA